VIDPPLYDRLEELSLRSGRSIAEIIEEMLNRSCAESVESFLIDS
jgi:predicted DNA-binding protein